MTADAEALIVSSVRLSSGSREARSTPSSARIYSVADRSSPLR